MFRHLRARKALLHGSSTSVRKRSTNIGKMENGTHIADVALTGGGCSR
jgi:hypothetical protein